MGIDLAERATFGHLNQAAILRAADRWLRPGERAWCAAQPSLRVALVTVLTCKEAVFKAFSAAPDAHGLSLAMHGRGGSGWAALEGMEPALVAVSWMVSELSVLSLAVASPSGGARRLLGELASGGSRHRVFGATLGIVRFDACPRHLTSGGHSAGVGKV